MIYDLLTNYNLYSKANARLALGFEWLSKLDPKTLDGRIDIKGDEVFAIVQSYTTFPANEKRFETHKDHIDIQYIFVFALLTQVMQAKYFVHLYFAKMHAHHFD